MSTATDKSYNPTKLNIEWVKIPEGQFLMGLSEDQAIQLYGSKAWDDETPQHQVSLATFYISRYPITCQQFTEFVHSVHPDWDIRPDDHPLYEKHPTFVSYSIAQEFCSWIGARLPTSEEWEKAARGTDGRLFPWGNEWNPGFGNFGQAERRGKVGGRKTSPVDAYSEGASPFGVYDTVGNCYEWTQTTKRIGADDMKIIRGSDTDRSAITPRAHAVTAIMIGGLSPQSYPPNTGFRVVIDKLPGE